jgi:GTP-binding protein
MEIKDATYLISNPSVDKCPKADRPEFAFIGRSNVGKSSLINMLCNKKNLAKTSATPGKTQLINHFEIVSVNNKSSKTSKWYLVDLPGYGYAVTSKKNRKSWGKMIEDYIRKRENLISLFVLIDSRHEPQQLDIDFINQLGEWQIPFAIVFTKADKNKPGKTVRQVQEFSDAVKKYWSVLPPIFVSSALNKQGRAELLSYIEQAAGFN